MSASADPLCSALHDLLGVGPAQYFHYIPGGLPMAPDALDLGTPRQLEQWSAMANDIPRCAPDEYLFTGEKTWSVYADVLASEPLGRLLDRPREVRQKTAQGERIVTTYRGPVDETATRFLTLSNRLQNSPLLTPDGSRYWPATYSPSLVSDNALMDVDDWGWTATQAEAGKLQFDYLRLHIERDWWDPSVLDAPIWRWRPQQTQQALSLGVVPVPRGQRCRMPVYPTEVVLLRKYKGVDAVGAAVTRAGLVVVGLVCTCLVQAPASVPPHSSGPGPT